MECAFNASRFESTAVVKELGEEEDDWRSSSSTTTTSSWIGINSDDDVSGGSSVDGGYSDQNEVQSSYKGGLDMMGSLQQVLPLRRGISSFYNGKSKSFTSLAEASSISSIKDMEKPENAYSRRRRSLLGINHVWDKTKIKRSIRPIRSSKSTLALAVALSRSETSSTISSDDSASTSCPLVPPLHPPTRTSFNNNSPSWPSSSWRSFWLANARE